jgi:uncharacterized oligopeptide transporter (OPT) family protein
VTVSRQAAVVDPEAPRAHPTVFEPVTLIAAAALAILGVVIGLELLTRVGVTPTTSVIGAILAMGLARVPLAHLASLRDVHRQNLLQTVISSATFGGANAVFLPIGVTWLTGRVDLLPAMFVGATLGMTIDACILYWLFDSPAYPASGAWPVGVATAECLIAGDQGGRRARLLAIGGMAGAVGQSLGIPMDVVGVCWIGNVAALSMFGIGLIVRAYARPVLGVDVQAMYLPHGVMIGAGLVAVAQIAVAIGRRPPGRLPDRTAHEWTRFRAGMGGGLALYAAAACVMAGLGGLYAQMAPPALAGFILFAAAAALVHDLVVGISAMHAGWFPAFATALIFLVLGVLIGFPTAPLALLVGFTASTGPAFADLGYDFKTGWIIRGRGKDPAAELEGRRQQFIAAMLGFAIAAAFVWFVHGRYFSRDLLPPADRVYAATIAAGSSRDLLARLLLWAVPGALVQFAGGTSRQIGVLFATGLLIDNGVAGWTALAALVVRRLVERRFGRDADAPMQILAGGFLAGSALTSFASATARSR